MATGLLFHNPEGATAKAGCQVTRDVNEARTLEAEARTLEAEADARTIEAKAEAIKF